MLVAHDRATVSIVFQDREGNERSTSLSFPFALPIADLQGAMTIWTHRAGALSNASIARWYVNHIYERAGPNDASYGADLLSKLALYYRNGDIFDRLWIPSPRPDMWEIIGPYAGVRLDSARPNIADLVISMEAITSFICTPEGESFPSEFVAGGLAL